MVVLLIIFAALLTVPKMLGGDTYVVMSGSMEPAHKTGSLIYTKKTVSADELQIGDVITFRLNGSSNASDPIDVSDTNLKILLFSFVGLGLGIGTAFITDISTDDGIYMFQTKGDANEAPDPNPVHEDNVIGKVMFSIPYLGYAADYVQHPPGIYIAAMLGIVLLLLTFISDRRKPRKK